MLTLLSSLSVHTMIWIFKVWMPLKVQHLVPSNIVWKSLSESGSVIRKPWLIKGIFTLLLDIQLSINSCIFRQLAQRHLHFNSTSFWLGCFTPHSSDKLLHMFFLPPYFSPSLCGFFRSLFVIKLIWYYLQELYNYKCGFMKMKFL